MFNASKVQRLFFFNLSSFILLGFWLTGFDKVHWFSWVIPAALYFAAFSGFCLGLFVSEKMLALFGIQDTEETGNVN